MTTGAAPRGTNRRLTARRACLLTVRYKTGKNWHPATAVNISQQGCRLRLGEDLERGTTVGVLFETPLRDGATTLNAELEGVVSWSRLEGLSYQVGIQFIAAPQALQDLMNSLA
jgi:PilZ domain-containing protein